MKKQLRKYCTRPVGWIIDSSINSEVVAGQQYSSIGGDRSTVTSPIYNHLQALIGIVRY
jgi:hypothetical protein